MELRAGGWSVALRKVRSFLVVAKRFLRLVPALPAVIAMRLIRPVLVFRIQPLTSSVIGHLAVNTAIFVCETRARINTPQRPFIDVCYYEQSRVANRYLASAWGRVLRLWPRWLAGPIHELNQWLPGGAVHTGGTFARYTRDINNALERFPPVLSFTNAEEAIGERALRELGVPPNAPFVCLVARDGAYHETTRPGENFDYHSYRDAPIENFVDAAESLAERGCYVLRMGSVVKRSIPSSHPRVIDYAASGLRTEFLDVYLGAKCLFCLTVGSGIDSVPMIFRRPMAYVNIAPICNFPTFVDGLFLGKRHYHKGRQRFLTLTETFENGAAFCLSTLCYRDHDIELIENTPTEIASVATEIYDRITGRWAPHPDDERLQRRFWDLYPLNTRQATEGHRLHGAVRARHSAHFLRENEWWLQ